jgi:hypothetical protein
MYHIFLPHTPVPYRSGEPGPPRLEERGVGPNYLRPQSVESGLVFYDNTTLNS